MTESNAKELEKQELRNTDAQLTAPPADVPPIEPTAPPSEPEQDPADAELDRIVAEQQALMDKRMQKEAEEKEKVHDWLPKFTFTAFINFKHYVKVSADTDEEALNNILNQKLGDYISRKDIRFDKQKSN